MAKIVHKGMWIDIKSLNAKDKKNFLTSLAFGFIASILWGIHLSHIGFLGNEPITRALRHGVGRQGRRDGGRGQDPRRAREVDEVRRRLHDQVGRAEAAVH